jgi:hypothetical protein
LRRINLAGNYTPDVGMKDLKPITYRPGPSSGQLDTQVSLAEN